MGLAAVMHPRTDSAVADQLSGGLKAGDGDNRAQDSHDGEQAKAGQLHQQRYHLGPGRFGAESDQFLIDFGQLWPEKIQRREIPVAGASVPSVSRPTLPNERDDDPRTIPRRGARSDSGATGCASD